LLVPFGLEMPVGVEVCPSPPGVLTQVAMQEAVLNITRVKFTPTLSNGRPLERMGNRSASGAYADLLVRCAGVEPFDAMVEIIGREDLKADARFSTLPERARHVEELTGIIEAWTMKRDKHEVMGAFAGRGIPCGAVLDTTRSSPTSTCASAALSSTSSIPRAGDFR
jgi:crotonobetainyl-CoA:carnitine CoA-transferase CaiB-like acyl-CoA transferase